MNLEAMVCTGCGSTNVVFDPKKRIMSCHTCGKQEYYSRATLNSNGQVIYGRRNAMRFFEDGKWDDARHYAMEVLNISMDNAAALYIIAYYDEFRLGKSHALDNFFIKMSDIALEYEEVQDIRKLILASAFYLAEYEEEVITLIAQNMQAPEDAEDLCEFIDKLCPYLISKRTSADFLTPKMVEIYQELAAHCGIPKTCFALLKSIDTNPDSPFRGDSFYLKAKTKYFYENYITPIKDILSAMNQQEYQKKFMLVYQKKCVTFKERANI